MEFNKLSEQLENLDFIYDTVLLLHISQTTRAKSPEGQDKNNKSKSDK